jgi:galactonate dehydratase
MTIETEEDITGIGESGTWGFLEASQVAVEKFKRYLVGENPLRIEHHRQYMCCLSDLHGAAIISAASELYIVL